MHTSIFIEVDLLRFHDLEKCNVSLIAESLKIFNENVSINYIAKTNILIQYN